MVTFDTMGVSIVYVQRPRGRENQVMDSASWAQAVKERDGWRCQECGATDNLHAHHIRPRALGGKNVLSNGVTLCVKHHRALHVGALAPNTMAAVGKSPSKVKGISATREWWAMAERGARDSGVTSLSNFIRIAVDRYLSKTL